MSKSSLSRLLALGCMLTPVVHAQVMPVILLHEVEVRGETVQLSDLLPSDAAPALMLAAETTGLGRTPEPGSFRIFTAKQLQDAIGGKAEFEFPAPVVVRRLGWPLNVERVRRALIGCQAAKSWDLSQATVLLPGEFTTRTFDPGMDVVHIGRGPGPRTLTASVRCLDRAACGSFLAQMVFERALPPIDAVSTSPAPSLASHTLNRIGPVLVQPGRRASLVFTSTDLNLKITTMVFPLRRARLGETVRVFDPVMHRVQIAEVTGDGLLRPKISSSPEGKPVARKEAQKCELFLLCCSC